MMTETVYEAVDGTANIVTVESTVRQQPGGVSLSVGQPHWNSDAGE